MANEGTAQPKSSPWVMPAKPDNGEESQILLIATDTLPRVVRICYTTGPEGSYVKAQGNTRGGTVVFTRIYKGGCADVGGTRVELWNSNKTSASGTYEVQATDPVPEKPKAPAESKPAARRR